MIRSFGFEKLAVANITGGLTTPACGTTGAGKRPVAIPTGEPMVIRGRTCGIVAVEIAGGEATSFDRETVGVEIAAVADIAGAVTVTFGTGAVEEPVEPPIGGTTEILCNGATLEAVAAIAPGLTTTLPVLMIVGATEEPVADIAPVMTVIRGRGATEEPVAASAGGRRVILGTGATMLAEALTGGAEIRTFTCGATLAPVADIAAGRTVTFGIGATDDPVALAAGETTVVTLALEITGVGIEAVASIEGTPIVTLAEVSGKEAVADIADGPTVIRGSGATEEPVATIAGAEILTSTTGVEIDPVPGIAAGKRSIFGSGATLDAVALAAFGTTTVTLTAGGPEGSQR